MKSIHLSDIHLDINSQLLGVSLDTLLHSLADWLCGLEYDHLFLTGDLSNDMVLSLQMLDYLSDCTPGEVFFVPGNHEFYSSPSGSVNLDIYEKSRYNLFHNGVELSDGSVVVGGLGWYDYTFIRGFSTVVGDLGFSKSEIPLYKKFFWNNSEIDLWENGDIGIAQKYREVFLELTEGFRDRDLLFLTHFVPFDSFLKVSPDDDVWNFCNAFMGSFLMGELLHLSDNIRGVFFGHTHSSNKVEVIGDKFVSCSAVGYVDEWGDKSFESRLEEVYTVFNHKF